MKEIDSKLLTAARAGDAPVCLDLIARGADVNAANDDEQTALNVAAFDGHADACRVLLEHGANVNYVDKHGWSALHWAASRVHADLCLDLLKCSADPLLKNKMGLTALDVAVWHKDDHCASVIQSWIVASAARAALQEITTPVAVPPGP